jgi:hypothetical protein
MGFSATGTVFIAYAMVSSVLWIPGDMFESFDHPPKTWEKPEGSVL